MPGMKITLPIAFSDTSIPIIQDDFLFPAGNGPLFLADLANDLSGVVPASVPNYAWAKAAALLGSGTQSSLAGTFSKNGGWVDSTDGKVERTSKGGLHVIVSKVNNSTTGHGCALALPSVIPTYLRTNPTHQFYYSLWGQMTRIASAPTSGTIQSGLAFYGVSSTVYNWWSYNTGQRPSTPTPAGNDQSSNNTVANFLHTFSGGSNAWQSSAPPANDTGNTAQLLWGSTGMNAQAGLANCHSSWILYRVYLEDLTVSGRSYATVRALDLAAYTAQVLTTGGLYNGDTFTAVSTLP